MSLASTVAKNALPTKLVARDVAAAVVKHEAPKQAGGMVDHAVFFDTNFDRIVTIKETRQGLQDISFGQKISYLMAPIANLALGEGLRMPKGTSLWQRLKNLFTIDLDKLAASAAAEHGAKKWDPAARVASQMAFDTEKKGAVTLAEIGKWVDAQNPGGKNGRTKAGFGQLFQIGADTTKTVTESGVEKAVPAMSSQALTHFYEGTLFYDIAKRNGKPHPLPPAR